MKRIIIFFLGLALVTSQLKFTDAVCCRSVVFVAPGYGGCGDGYCCGRGPCNIFCCNCDGGCKKRWEWDGKESIRNKRITREARSMVQNTSLTSATYFRNIDIDGSNAITMEEAEMYLKNEPKFKRNVGISLQKHIRRMDTNNDGIISLKEFDESL